MHTDPLTTRVVLHAKPPETRKHPQSARSAARNSNSPKRARRESEPWLLVMSPALSLSARQLIALHGRRMEIELWFCILKSHSYGQGFEDSIREGERIEVPLLLGAMTAFANWLVSMACECCSIDAWLAPF